MPMFFILIKVFVVVWLILSLAASIVMDLSALYVIVLLYSLTATFSFILFLPIFLAFPRMLYGFLIDVLLFIVLVSLKFLSISYT